MQTVRRILVAVKEPTKESLPAVDKAAQLARACNAQLELFHALAAPIYLDTRWTTKQSTSSIEHQLRAQSLKHLEAIATRVRRLGIDVRCSVEWDFPVHESIVRHASRIKADLIVAECHQGRRTLPWLLRLTDWELLRVSPLPVLLVKNSRPYRNPVVLAALDPTHAFAKPSGLDAQILKAGATVRRALRGTLHAMHAYVPIPKNASPADVLSGEFAAELQEQAKAEAQRALDDELRHSAIPRARRHLIGRHPIDAIQDAVRKTRAAILVMGAISRSGFKRFYIGNTAERLLSALPCDVLVVKPAKFASRIARARRGARVRNPMPVED